MRQTNWSMLQSRTTVLAMGFFVLNWVSVVASTSELVPIEWMREHLAVELLLISLLFIGYVALRLRIPRYLSDYPSWAAYQKEAGSSATGPIIGALQEMANDISAKLTSVKIDGEDFRKSMNHFRNQYCDSGPTFRTQSDLYKGEFHDLGIKTSSISDAYRFSRSLVGGAYNPVARYLVSGCLAVAILIWGLRAIGRLSALMIRLIVGA